MLTQVLVHQVLVHQPTRRAEPFDNFSTLVQAPTGTQIFPPLIQGQININTAPREVLSMLPYMEGQGVDFVTGPPPHLSSALVGYRDMQTLSTGVDYKTPGSGFNTRANVTGITLTPAAPALRVADAFTSFLSIGEPLMVRVNQIISPNPNYNLNPNVIPGMGATGAVAPGISNLLSSNITPTPGVGFGYNSTIGLTPTVNVSPPADGGSPASSYVSNVSNGAVASVSYGPSGGAVSGYDPNNPPAVSIASDIDKYDMTRLAQTGQDATALTGDVTGPDGVVNDFKEEMLHYNRISNLITTRSECVHRLCGAPGPELQPEHGDVAGDGATAVCGGV